MAYLPPNGGRMNVTIGSNTAGVSSLISSGTMTLAGGSNITLSQNGGNAITIHGGAGGAAGSNTFGMSNLGNTSGTSGVISGSALQYAFAGGNNVTLSQSINASSATITISAANQTVQTQNRFNATLSGNTAGVMAEVSSGTLTLAGGNNITLSQNGNAITISGGAGGGGAALSAAGASASNGTIVFSNSNGIGFGMNGSTITASHNGITSQTNQTLGFSAGVNTSLTSTGTYDARSMWLNGRGAASVGFSNSSMFVSAPQTSSLHATGAVSISMDAGTISIGAPAFSAGLSTIGNTTGTSGMQTNRVVFAGGNNIMLSQSNDASGATITISGSAGGGGIALANSETTYSTGTAQLSVVAGAAMTIASTTGQKYNFSVPAVSSLVGTNGISLSTNGSTISISRVANTLDFYQNMDRGTSVSLATANGTLMLQRLNQENNYFAGNITANTLLLNMTANMTATVSSSSHTVSASIGIYSDNVTRLNLINSASTSWALGANTSNSANYHGPRWLSFVSSQWSSAPVFAEGGEYVFGVMFRSSNFAPPLSYIGQNYMHSNQRSGSIGTTLATNTSLAQGNYWNAMYSASTTAFPAVITSNQVNRNNATAIYMPHVLLNNRYSGTF